MRLRSYLALTTAKIGEQRLCVVVYKDLGTLLGKAKGAQFLAN